MAPPLKPRPVSIRSHKTSKVNKPNVINKPKVNTTLHKKKEKEKESKKNNSSGDLDEKGNPYPKEDPGGGDPICPPGYKIDYDFDPFNDPINPPFRCIPALKDPDDGPTTNIINKLNNPASNITDLASVIAPAAGGGRSAKRIQRRKHMRMRMRKRKITQRHKK